jgi:signal transduction histidine kinase
LNVGRERVGILFVNYRSAYNFSAQDKAAIELFANTAAIAIQNARNYSNIQKKARHLEALNKAAGVISASVGLEQREILFRILKEAVESVTAAFGSKATSGDIYTYDPQSELLTLQAVYPPAGSGQAARPQLSLSQVRVGEFLRNELAVPIFIDSRLWGVLSVHSAAGELDEDDLAALNKLAEMAVVALKNAETARQLGRANAVAIMGAWGADIVHDINREVGAIRRVLFDLSERPDLPPGFQEQLARIDHSAGELALPSLPDQPPEPGKSLELRDAPFVDAVISSEMARYQVSHPRIEWQFTPRCPQAQAAMHEQWLRRILRHLFNNAADAMPESHPGVVAVRAAAGKEMVEIEVEDNGGGIPPRVESLLFSQPAPGAPGKMGRGLLLVRFLVEQHGGQVQLKRNQPGKGACFAIHIPVLSQG